MNRTGLILLIACEVISLMLIYRLWTHKHRPGIIERCVLSIILLVPLLGWIFYGFVATSPESHDENLPMRDDGGGGGGGGYHGGGHGAGHG